MDEQFDDAPQLDPTEFDLERFTLCARDALSSAEIAARKLGDSYIGTEHMLVGLAMTESGAAYRVLEPLQLTPSRLAEMMHFIRGTETVHVSNGVDSGLSPRLIRVLAKATKVANDRGDTEIGTIHILLGLLRERQGLSVFLLDSAGLGPKRLDHVVEIAQRAGWTDDD